MKFLKSLSEILLRIEELIACLVSIENNRHVNEKRTKLVENYQHNFLDVQEVKRLLKISDRQLYNLRKKHDLPERLISGKLYFKLSDIEKLARR